MSNTYNMVNITGINTTEAIKNSLVHSCQSNNGEYSAQCLYDVLCPQMSQYFINTGIIIIVAYIVLSWLCWWFFKYGYKHLKYDKNSAFGKWLGDLDKKETRAYWDNFIKTRLVKVMLGYIAVVVWFHLR